MQRIILVAALLGAMQAHAQEPVTVFRGRPILKISEGGLSRTPESLSRDKALNLECVISQIGEHYYWASRENAEVVPVESGAFLTYVALNGLGYVRVIVPELAGAAALMSPAETKFDYVEHLLIGLGSVTYYGKRRP